jgi:CPA1 family monovalent cation:H+ antiporter
VIEVSESESWDGRHADLPGNPIRRQVVSIARDKAKELRRSGAIGDDAYHVLETEFDWTELSAGADG